MIKLRPKLGEGMYDQAQWEGGGGVGGEEVMG